jgi:segregation and condensation protein B
VDGAVVQEAAQEAAQFVEERPEGDDDSQLKAILEAIVYITDEPLSAQQMAAALAQPLDKVKRLLDGLVADCAKPERGLSIREVAGGYKMSTKVEHHESVRAFVKKLTPPLRLSLAALETLSVVAYKQPVTAPEIMDVRGVQGAGVLKTLLDRKLIAEAGRKKVVGQPILYKTTKEFLVQFGLKDLSELPTIKEFEELGRMELVEEAPVQQTLIEEIPAAQEKSTEEKPVEEAPAEGVAAADETAHTQEAAAEPVTTEETAAEPITVEETAVEETAAEQPPVDEPKVENA